MGMHSTYTATHYKDLNIDWQARAVTRHGEDILLTPQEFALLQVLFDHRGQAVSRGDLLHTAWGYPCIGITRTVDVHIQHLRRKLGLKQEIQTIYRVGVYPFLNIIGNTNQYFFRLCPSKSGLSPLSCGIMRVFGCI